MDEGSTEDIVAGAIAKDAEAIRSLVRLVGPVIHGRVAKALMRRRGREASRDIDQEIEDLVQEVFLALFDEDARALRAWDPSRSPLGGFVALITDHQVFSIFRSGRRRPWSDDLDIVAEPEDGQADTTTPEARVASREALDELLDRLREELTPKGFDLFVRLYVDEQSVEQVGAELAMSADAIYAWRTRLSRAVRKIAKEIEGSGESSASAGAMSDSDKAGSTQKKEASSSEDRSNEG